jgi:hypothetical protein
LEDDEVDGAGAVIVWRHIQSRPENIYAIGQGCIAMRPGAAIVAVIICATVLLIALST